MSESTGWLYLEHDETGGSQRIPDDPAVLASQEARGWRLADEPAQPVGLPPKVKIDPGAAPVEWVELVHPVIGARHDFPNNPAAVAGAAEAGWVIPNKDGSVPKRALTRAAREVGVDVDDLPAAPDGQDAVTEEPAGDTAGAEPNEPAESSATDQKE